MSYSQGGLIQATDYNSFAGGTAANVSGQLNTVLATGRGNAGYGQTAVSNVAAVSDTVTATQWTTLVNGVNKVRKHQTGAGFSNIGTYLAGETVNATNDISGNLTTAYTNRMSYTAQGSTTTGSTYTYNFSVGNTADAQTINITERTATFASADAARYFFNAGGQLNFVITGITNNDGTTRSASLVTLGATNFASKKIGGADAVARTGSGGTLNADLTTNYGYYAQSTSNTTMTDITGGTSAYTSDRLYFYVKTNGAQGSNADNGTVMYFNLTLYSGPQSPTFNDSINITVSYRVDVIYPSTTYLTDSWGTVTIA